VTSSGDDILDAIDGSLRDNSVSPDAMRWSPDPEAARQERQAGLAGFIIRPADVQFIECSFTIDVRPFIEPLTRSMADLSEAFTRVGRACSKAVVQMATMCEAHYHPYLAARDRRHRARCRTCNPAGNPLPLPGGGEYRRRQLARKRRRR